ncbi:glycosyl hydrolase [Segetibacter sp. 3557_3]|uniref:glycoside hydrolase family 127 protein n=1 Tax=Segetibacter sp. 3557_3 TaxID=2547429 RepID=UPI0010590C4E|nr:glycoside hydrolase family 127 protein [Segetibacter sp. 3557_3]TDH28681.1 glycosyl hydrolase [Segetibacter sp. 3557_3]
MKCILLALTILLAVPFGGFTQTGQVKMFPLSAVRLLNSPFRQAQQTDLKYILALNPDKLLAPYLREAGIEPGVRTYGNWEGTGLDGHIGGHYLSALANMYAATGDKELLRRLNYMIDKLAECQQKNGDGYVGGVPGGKAMWKDVAEGKINAGSFSLNNKWVPWYNIHKLFAGLADVYLIAGNQKAKTVLVKLSDWAINLTTGLSDQQVQRMLRSEHGGMNEVFADVSAITGDPKYLQLAKRFSHQTILNPLLESKDSLTGLHANTQIPKVIGYMRVAEVAGQEDWANAARFFWNTVVENRTVSIGGNSVREHFHPADNFASMMESKEGPETCNSYNMLKLTKHLFLAKPSVEYMDYYERTLYNHILSSQHPDGGFVYFTPMRPRHYRVYSQPDQGFWCCVGSGLENHGKYGELIYSHHENDLYVNLFIPSQLNWKEKGINVTQTTSFPASETSTIAITMNRPSSFALNLRYPGWVKKGQVKVLVNNKPVAIGASPATYITINRTWKSGDRVTISLPMETKTEYLPDGSDWVSFVHGPVVLAAATDTTDLVGLRADSSRMGHIANGPLYPVEEAPFIVAENKDFKPALTPVPGKPITFSAANFIYPDRFKRVELVPFYTIHDSRYMVYWPVTTADKLTEKLQAFKAHEETRLALEKITIDQVAPGEQQPESDHNYQGDRSETGVYKDQHWRNAKGWFSYDLKNTAGQASKLRVTYYGAEKDRNFNITINDTLVKTVQLDGTSGGKFVDVDYDIPEAVLKTSANGLLRVKFIAQPNSSTANVYYIRLLK